jgi:hypothetical protein
VRAPYGAVGDLVREPEPLQTGWHLGSDVGRLLGCDPVSELLKDQVDDRLGALFIAAQRFGEARFYACRYERGRIPPLERRLALQHLREYTDVAS